VGSDAVRGDGGRSQCEVGRQIHASGKKDYHVFISTPYFLGVEKTTTAWLKLGRPPGSLCHAEPWSSRCILVHSIFFTNQLHLQKYITADASKSAPGVHIILIMQHLNYGFLQNKPDILFSTNTNYNFKVFTFSGQPHDLKVH
jgi:hypothetical protein